MSDAADLITPADGSTEFKSRRGRRVLGLVLLLLVLLLALASFLLFRLILPPGSPTPDEQDTAGVTWVRSIYGMSNAPEDQFDMVQAAVPAPDGSIWVTDGIRQSLMRFTPDGRFVEALRGPEDDPLYSPSRIAVGPDGTLYACELTLDAVRVIDQDNNEAGSFGVPQPVSLAVTDDRIVVGAVSGFAILTKEGRPLEVVGSRGSADDQFDYVHGVAIAENGNIYVADSFNNRLSAYDAEGNRLWLVSTGNPTNNAEMVDGKLSITGESGEDTATAGPLQLPLGLTIDGAGRIVVVDMFECALAVFDAEDGTFIAKYGDAGADDGFFFYPVSVGYDAERDWFTVADYLNDRVQIVRIPGSSGGGDAVAAVRRALTGPLRACCFPLLLLVVLALIAWFVLGRQRTRVDAVPPEEGISDSGQEQGEWS